MKRFRFLLIGACALAWFPALAADEALPKAETVLDRFVEVTGGKAAYAKVKSEIVTMNMEFVGKGIKGTLTHYADDASHNSYESVDLEGIGKIDTGIRDGLVWEANPITGPRILDGAEKADRVRDGRFNAPIHWRELYKSAETTGMEEVDGDACFKVVLTPAEGKPETAFYSKKTGLLTKRLRTVVSPMGEISAEFFTSEYKVFDGINVPTRVSQRMMDNEILVTVASVKLNAEIAPERYEPPADIKKLMAK